MKKYIIGFIFGALIFGSISGVIAYSYNAKNIEYTPSDNSWHVSTVESAINDMKQNMFKLDTTTTAKASDIVKGKTAYNNLGKLITGTHEEECISGVYTKPANSNIDFSFPISVTKAQISFYNPNGNGDVLLILDNRTNNTLVIRYENSAPVISTGSTVHTITNTSFKSNYDVNGVTYKSQINYSYIICK